MKNFTTAARKADIIDFSLLPSGLSLDWIETNLGSAGAPYQAEPTGTKNGVNDTFLLPVSQSYTRTLIIRNRQVLLESAGDYTVSGITITMDASNIPESGDSLWFWGWTA